MQNIDLICIGKMNAKYFAEGVAEYQKRLAAFAAFRIIELPEDTDPEFGQRIHALKGKRLGCFCKPYPCHGDIIKEYLDTLDDE